MSPATLAGPPAAAPALGDAPVIDQENPWPGLVSFPEAAEAYFNGRDAERQDLLRLIRRETLTLLYGLSGLGKSSLLKAGLFPLLRQEHFLPVYVRLDHAETSPPHGEQVRGALLAECAACGVEAPPPREGESVWELLHRAEGGFWDARNYPVTPVLVIDQFEEIFTLGMTTPARRERARRFMAELGDLIDNRPPDSLVRRLDGHPEAAAEYAFSHPGCKIVLSMREDFLADLARLGEHTRSTFQNYLRLLRMRGDTAAEAILRTGGGLVDPQVARAIVWFLARVPDERHASTDLATVEVEPALLSLVCRELNDRRRDGGLDRIDVGLLDVSQTEILARFYRESFEGLNPGLRVFVEEELLTATGYRDAAAYDNALRFAGVTEEGIDALVARRLVRKEERFGAQRIELTHDVLTDVVRDSRDKRRAEEEAAKRRREYEAAMRARRRRAMVGGVFLAAVALAAFLWSGSRARAAAAQAEAAVQQQEVNLRFSSQLRARDEALRKANADVAQREADLRRMNGTLAQQESALATSQGELARKQDSVRAMLRTTAAALQRADVSEQVAVVGAETADYYLDVTGRTVRRQAAQSAAIDVTARAVLDSANAIQRRVDEQLRRSLEMERAVTGVLCGDGATGARRGVRAAVDSALASRKLCTGDGRVQAQGSAAVQQVSP